MKRLHISRERERERVDLILLDLVMPHKNGFETLQELKLNKSFADIPVIVLTNLGQEADEKKCRELGAVGYLIKANTAISQVVEEVKLLLEKKDSGR
ncbi:MAG: response regulator [Ignavibacteriaceae bacterium]